MLAVSDTLDGPYRVVRGGAPIVDPKLMTLDGSLYVDPKGKPWLVYAHEWWQTTVGTMEAVPLTDDLAAAGSPQTLFKANDAPWAVGQKQPNGDVVYVTDGPELYRSKTGTLLMLREAVELDGEAYPTHPCVAGHSSFDGAHPGC